MEDTGIKRAREEEPGRGDGNAVSKQHKESTVASSFLMCSYCEELKPGRTHFSPIQKQRGRMRLCMQCVKSGNMTPTATEERYKAAHVAAQAVVAKEREERAKAAANKEREEKGKEREERAEAAANKEREEQAKRQKLKEERNSRSVATHAVGFYDYDIKLVTYEASCLCGHSTVNGTYDVIFRKGCYREKSGISENSNRTTIGTATIMEDFSKDGKLIVSGTVTFEKELAMSDCLSFQRDLTLSDGTYDSFYKEWAFTVNAKAKIIDEDAAEVGHFLPNPQSARICCVVQRLAFGWTKYEGYWRIDEDIVKFDSLDHAQALVDSWGEGLNCKHAWLAKQTGIGKVIQEISGQIELTSVLTKKIQSYIYEPPVFFVEPGDLMILHADWCQNTFYYSEYVLRKQKVAN
jgi:hypothetical protein